MEDKTPAQVEAEEDETVQLEWLGETVTLPATAAGWDISVTRAYARGDLLAAIEGLVGKAAFARIEKAHRKANAGKFTNRDLRPLADQVSKLYGFDSAGE